MPLLTIVAHITANAGDADQVEAALQRLVAPTLAEAGCIKYDLHRDNENGAHFMFYETWESRELWQAHMKSDHLKEYGATTAGKIERFALYEMTQATGSD